VDNHNNILPFLSHAWNTEILPKGVPVVHIDAHSDLWPNAYDISFEQTIQEKDILVFTDTYTTIANYYQPLLRNGSISEVYRYE
jgi:UPF0489 domain